MDQAPLSVVLSAGAPMLGMASPGFETPLSLVSPEGRTKCESSDARETKGLGCTGGVDILRKVENKASHDGGVRKGLEVNSVEGSSLQGHFLTTSFSQRSIASGRLTLPDSEAPSESRQWHPGLGTPGSLLMS